MSSRSCGNTCTSDVGAHWPCAKARRPSSLRVTATTSSSFSNCLTNWSNTTARVRRRQKESNREGAKMRREGERFDFAFVLVSHLRAFAVQICAAEPKLRCSIRRWSSATSSRILLVAALPTGRQITPSGLNARRANSEQTRDITPGWFIAAVQAVAALGPATDPLAVEEQLVPLVGRDVDADPSSTGHHERQAERRHDRRGPAGMWVGDSLGRPAAALAPEPGQIEERGVIDDRPQRRSLWAGVTRRDASGGSSRGGRAATGRRIRPAAPRRRPTGRPGRPTGPGTESGARAPRWRRHRRRRRPTGR